MKNVLVVEDNPTHLTHAKEFLEGRVTNGAINRVDYVSTLDQALEKLQTNNYDGIITDVFFPGNEGFSAEEQNGTTMAQCALDRGIPVVLNTSTYHHGSRTQPVCDWVRKRNMKLVDMCVSKDVEAPTKNWFGAYVVLAYLMEGKDSGEITITPTGLNEPPRGTPAIFGANILLDEDYYRKEEELKPEIAQWLKENPSQKEEIEQEINLLKIKIAKYLAGMFK